MSSFPSRPPAPSEGLTTPSAPAPHRAAPGAPDLRPGTDLGLLLLRVAVGLTMAGHGTQKLFGWFDGGGLNGTADHFAADGYKAAKAMAWVAALTETFCGLGLAIGLLTPLAGAGILGIMLNAVATKWGGGFFAPEGVEYDLVLLTAAVALALTGPGRVAADQLLPVLRDHRFTRGVAAVALGALSAAFVLVVLRD
ncbi:DoxX family protein [Streptomyces spectabilis]|uniref:DoxX family protein n=1 Tax=Streptomyces spectabilis TaxID=68270 RepID=A0A516RJB5_STRST|nr:DoxX family protein [Streptomyces spectabilis]QDQ15758.1 DoxX family protein [Streptomyces spectabilis]